ncbi:MAG: glycosyltransferase family 4 protein [Gaiellaceae bacterium]
MRLAVVETARLGGLLHYAVQLGEALARRGHDVDVIAPRDNELVDRVEAARMHAVLPPTIKSVEQPRARLAYLGRRAGVGMRLARSWLRILGETRRGGYDAVIVNSDITHVPATVGAALLSRRNGMTVGDVCHNVRPFNTQGGDIYAEHDWSLRLLARVYSHFDVVFVHGENSRNEFTQTWPPANLAVIPHGDERIFADEPPPPSDEERVLFFGDLRKNKGLFVLKDAFDLLRARRPDARLTIAGTPAPADLDIEPLVDWAGTHNSHVEVIDRYVPLDDVPAVFGRARVVATPYLAGWQSGVIHLAMTMGRAVVTSDVGDLATAVGDGDAGLVVPPGDPQALADALERLLADRELAERLGAEGRRRMTTGSSWDAVAEKVEAALQSLPRR